MFLAQIVGIGKSQPCEGTKSEDIPNPIQSFVRQLFTYERLQFFTREMVFLLVVLLLEFIVPKRVFLDPFVTQAIAGKVLHAIEQIHGSVVLAVVGCL